MPIRPFRADDFNAIGKIYLDAKYAELAHEPHVFTIIPLAEDENLLPAFRESTVIVFETGAEVVGFAATYENTLRALFVHGSARNLGVGSALLHAVLTSHQAGLQLRVARSNLGAVRFYERHGFIRKAEEVRRYQGKEVVYLQMINTKVETRGHVVRTIKDGLPILWTYVPEMPDTDTRSALPWLAVIGWKYDGSATQGMPGTEENQHMLMLEAALAKLERIGFCREVYRRIGAGLREFVFYISDRDQFIDEFNRCVAGDPRYPISINFYLDEAWSELQDLIDDFTSAEQHTDIIPTEH